MSTTYAARTAWATNSPFSVNGGGTTLVNQTLAPSSLVNQTVNGQTASWQHLGTPITVSGGTVTAWPCIGSA